MPMRDPVGYCLLLPCLFVIHVNGYVGDDVNLRLWGDAGELRFGPHVNIASLAEADVTRLCPTLTTNSC